MSQRNRFFLGETFDVLAPGQKPFALTPTRLFNADGEPIESAPHAVMTVYMETGVDVPVGAYLRRVRT
ncbi:MAG: U32 family peptidase C-terminal domain-containing protein [Acutalibacteraceae bacterium]